MSPNERRHTTHEIAIDAPADAVYRIIAEATAWPQRFGPTVHVERTGLDGDAERLHIWAAANGEVKSWTSRRVLDARARRVEFRQEVSSPPVAAMGGTWTVRTRASGGTQLILEHDFEAVGNSPEGLDWISRATDRNSQTELANIKALAERGDGADELVFSFESHLDVHGHLDAVYEFLYDAARWPERLPHVARLELREDVENLQWMAMDTRAKDGSVHTTESVRVCLPPSRIVYKQLVTPVLLEAHTGEWEVDKVGDAVRVTSRHTVTINEAAIGKVLGDGADVAAARTFLRTAIGGNSEATLALAKKFAERDGD